MTFLDDLTIVLDLMVLVAVAIFYTGFWVWFELRRKDQPRALVHLREGAVMLGSLGVVLGIFAIWGELTWPLSVVLPNGTNVLAAYDLLFFDSMVLLAFLLVAFMVTVLLRLPTHFVGILGAVSGIGIGYYGYRAYNLSLTLDPLETFLLFLGFAAVGVASYPVTLYIDTFVIGPSVPGVDPVPSEPKPKYRLYWNLFVGIFLLFVVLAGIAALWYGFDAAWGHLAAPP